LEEDHDGIGCRDTWWLVKIRESADAQARWTGVQPLSSLHRTLERFASCRVCSKSCRHTAMCRGVQSLRYRLSGSLDMMRDLEAKYR